MTTGRALMLLASISTPSVLSKPVSSSSVWMSRTVWVSWLTYFTGSLSISNRPSSAMLAARTSTEKKDQRHNRLLGKSSQPYDSPFDRGGLRERRGAGAVLPDAAAAIAAAVRGGPRLARVSRIGWSSRSRTTSSSTRLCTCIAKSTPSPERPCSPECEPLVP